MRDRPCLAWPPRVTVVPDDRTHEARVLAIGRLSLFGPGAARLHDELVVVAAPFRETADGDHLVPSGTEADRLAVADLENLLTRVADLPPVKDTRQKLLVKTAASDFASLWRHVRDEADGRAHAASQLLQARGAKEAEDLRQILKAQRVAIDKQLGLFDRLDVESMKPQREQLQSERDDMQKRRARIGDEIQSEPIGLQALYQVSLKRLTPVGLVYLWPTTSP